ncbi:hypothetical protein SODALDRAFT_272032 [Sodiomyces alkalinus F11]|uniref:Phosphoglycerate mutase-like protein n=1 Tax=Sodiomyces alkalinus (strain CBS 110278 / VKM F-3762 / F11) TaxID=1314773 RepID=A0A3N2Q1W2_SODAK|nr:hypothetical protein SODALDRAFT_272032 [Sodiomyces alkalinus F11]ROT40751.1 hypothetical protein SODALDRAFT_272032 [Sodiomyces alkalinus F11]
MGKPPAYIFVVRHGARLDQADKSWHLSAQNPYDPPLTYGGWRQAQAVGARVAAILREAEAESEQASRAARAAGIHKKRKKFRVVVHTSPFLRCVQTSIGITAGLATPIPSSTASQATQPPLATAAATATATATDSLSKLSLQEGFPKEPEKKIQKTPLRIDAFLGEWLNPEYFESITRPPCSAQMLAAAKVALLRKEAIPPRPHSSSTSQGRDKLWSSLVSAPTLERTDSMDSNGSVGLGLDLTTPAMASVFGRTRADSAASSSSQRTAVSAEQEDTGGYVAPIPHYAASTNKKIPDGYVAHARDACTAPDYQWDTSQHPWSWGDGGEYGEEWITMHRRFRNGLQRLVDWYATTTDDPTNLVTKLSAASPLLGTSQAYEPLQIEADEEEAESVVVLVSHGAGCNAMIGAITRQPVLMDVGVATLTMARRKNDDPVIIGPDGQFLDPSSGAEADVETQAKVPVDQHYDLKIQASNEHLRNLSVSSSSGMCRHPSVSSNPGFNPHPHPHPSFGCRGRVSTMNSSYPATGGGGGVGGGGLSYPDLGCTVSRSNSASAHLGGARKPSATYTPAPPRLYNGITVGSGATSFTSPQARSAVPSLWTPTGGASSLLGKRRDEEEDDEDDMFPDFDGTRRFSVKSASAEDGDADPPKAPDAPQKDKAGETVRSLDVGNERKLEAARPAVMFSTGLWGL